MGQLTIGSRGNRPRTGALSAEHINSARVMTKRRNGTGKPITNAGVPSVLQSQAGVVLGLAMASPVFVNR